MHVSFPNELGFYDVWSQKSSKFKFFSWKVWTDLGQGTTKILFEVIHLKTEFRGEEVEIVFLRQWKTKMHMLTSVQSHGRSKGEPSVHMKMGEDQNYYSTFFCYFSFFKC